MIATTIKSANGKDLFFEKNIKKSNTAKILLIHGYTEHSGRYHVFLDAAMQAGFDTYRYDQQGFGKSEGPKAYINRFQDYVDDLDKVMSHIEDDDKPLFILSHSMGGLVLAKYLVDKNPTNIKGVVFSAPAVMIPADMSPILQKLSGIISVIAPKLKTVKLDSNALSRDKSEIDKYLADPLVYHEGAYARTGAEIIKTQKWIQTQFKNIHHPFLLLHGSADKLAEPKGSDMLYNEASSDDKEFNRYKNYYHELLFEPGREQIEQKILDWMVKRIK